MLRRKFIQAFAVVVVAPIEVFRALSRDRRFRRYQKQVSGLVTSKDGRVTLLRLPYPLTTEGELADEEFTQELRRHGFELAYSTVSFGFGNKNFAEETFVRC